VLSPNVRSALALTVGRFVLGMLPALLIVVFAGVIALLALIMDKGRREYALQVADRFIKFAAVLVGARSAHDDLDTERYRPQLPPSALPPLDTG
jgi:hypothetical protein